MKNKFSKFINLQGKYLTSLLFVLFFAVGQMWAATYTYDFGTATDFSELATTATSGKITMAQTSYTLAASESGAPSRTFTVAISSVANNKSRKVTYKDASNGLNFERCGALAFSLTEPSIVKILVKSKDCQFGIDPYYGTTYTNDTYGNFGANSITTLTKGTEITITCDAGNYKICCSGATGGSYNIKSIKITPAAKVTFDGNGATSGSMEAVYFEKGVATNLPANAFEKSGNDFGGWKDASENTYADEQSVTLSANLALTAQWVEPLPRYAVKYNKGANGTGTIADGEKIDGTPFTLSSDMFTRESYLQVGWTETDGNARDYMLGGKYTTDAAITLYPAWAQKVTDVAAFSQASGTPAGWTFSNDGYSSDSKATVAYVKDFSDNSLSTPVNNGMDNDWVAFAKNTSACATYDLGYVTTVSALNVTLYGGSSSAFDQKIEYVGADGSTVLKTYTNSLSAGNWASNSISKTDIIPNVRYIKVYGASKWVVMSAFSVTYGDLSTKYAVNFAKGHADATGAMAAVEYKEGATVTAPACGFERDGYTFSKWSVSGVVGTTEVLKDGTFAMPANTVTLTAQWIETSVTYDITYVSAHGTAPAADNAASVVLAELSETGWAHKGWTANVDVTVDAATVEAGTLIANGKTVILGGDVTFTAVWKEIFTVTFNSKGGSAVDPIDVEDGASIAAAPADPTKDDYIFLGWSETDGGDVVADITAITISDDKTFYAKWKLDVQVTEIVFSNSFKGWIVNNTVTVYYMEGESAPTITSYAGKNLKAEGGVVISGDKIVATGTDESVKQFDLTMTAVAPFTTTGAAQTFDGTETYVKTRHAWTSDKKWKMSKYVANDPRIARGECSMYFFFGPAESVTFNWAKQQVTEDVAVYVNGTFVKNIGKNNNTAIELSKGNNMVAFYSLQTSGDVYLNGLTLAPWVPVTAVTLKEGEDEISAKEIWAGTNFTLTAEVTPDNASDKTITWTSSNDAVATVVNGVVTGVAANAIPAIITASTVDGVTATCAVTVTAAPEPCETPVITADPASQAYCAGSEPTLTVAANDPSDGGTLHYAWFKAGETDEAVGTDAASYTVEAAGTYYVIVTNKKDGNLDASATSANAVVTLNTPASITTQPTDLKKQTEGANITLSVVAANATGYQWYSCDNKDKENPSLIAGADEAEYEFAAAAGFFYCEVTGLCGTIESNVAEVTIKRTAGCQYINATSGSQANLADGTIMYACGSDGKLSTGDNFATASANAKGIDAGAVGSINKQYCVVKFPVDVEEITLYGYNGSNREINNLCTGDAVGTDIKVNTAFTAYTKSKANDGYERSMTIEFDEPFAKEKYLFIKYNSALEIYRICYTAAIERPVIATQPVSNTNFAFDADLTATVEVNAVTEGTLYYQWYDASDDSEVDGATAATLTTSVDGEYYVIVTNKLAGHKDNSVKSQTVALAHRDATDATLSALGYGDPATTIALVADKYEYIVVLDEGTTVVPALSATATKAGYANVLITNAAAFVDYKATSTVQVTAEDGVTIKTYTVKFTVDHEYTAIENVTGNTSWSWAGVADVTEGDGIVVDGSHGLVLANYISAVNFEKLEAHVGARAYRSNSYPAYQGTSLKFHTTVAGKLVINARRSSGSPLMAVNGAEIATLTSTLTEYVTFVPAGDVTITATGNEMRIYSMEFQVLSEITPSYTRDNLNPNNIGTLCWKNDGVLFGGTVYELTGKDENSKLVFDEVIGNVIKGGKPCIFVPENGNTEIKIYNTKNQDVDAGEFHGMKGTYVELSTIADGENSPLWGNYIISNNKYIYVDYTNCKLGEYRAYIKPLENVPSADPNTNGAPRRRLVVGGNQAPTVVTGVENLNASEQPIKLLINGQIYILRGEKMYDATGRLVK